MNGMDIFTHFSWFRIDGEIVTEKIIAQDIRNFVASNRVLYCLNEVQTSKKREKVKKAGGGGVEKERKE